MTSYWDLDLAAAERGFAATQRAFHDHTLAAREGCGRAVARSHFHVVGERRLQGFLLALGRWRSRAALACGAGLARRGGVGEDPGRADAEGAGVRIRRSAEVMADEYRVALTPAGANQLVRRGTTCGWSTGRRGLGPPRRGRRERVGARVGARRGLGLRPGVKVKEPQPAEFGLPARRPGALRPTLTSPRTRRGRRAGRVGPPRGIRDRGGPRRAPAAAGAHERDRGPPGGAGRGHALERPPERPRRAAGRGGRGRAGVGGRRSAPASSGRNAAIVAAGMQAHVQVLDTDLGRLRELGARAGRPGDPAALHAPGDRGVSCRRPPTCWSGPGARRRRAARRPREPRALRLMRPGSVIVKSPLTRAAASRPPRRPPTRTRSHASNGVVHYWLRTSPARCPVRPPGAGQRHPPHTSASPRRGWRRSSRPAGRGLGQRAAREDREPDRRRGAGRLRPPGGRGGGVG